MFPNPEDNNRTLFDAFYYCVYSDGKWQPWVSAGNIAGKPDGSHIQGVGVIGYFFN